MKIAFAALLLACSWALPAAPSISTVSVPSAISRSAAGHSFAPSFSDDGHFLLFVSQANNLVTVDNRLPFLDVFIRDLGTGENSLVSVGASGRGGANGNSSFPVVSAGGERIAFVSAANDLVTNDFNGESDIFVRDRLAGVTRLISVNSSGTASALGPSAPAGAPFLSSEPGISADGRWVIFRSRATNLVALPDGNGGEDIYVRDLELETTRLVSVNAEGSRAANGRSSSPSMSADGRKVVFISTAQDIVPGATSQASGVYLRDLDAGPALWISRDLPFPGAVRCANPVLSGDANAVVFTVESVNGSTFWLCRRLLSNGSLSLLATNRTDFGIPAVSGNGEIIVFEREFDSTESSPRAIYLWRGPAGITELVSGSNDVAIGSAALPALSTDGRFVSYVADLPGETAADRPITHVFLRDLLLPAPQLISVVPMGQASGQSVDPVTPAFRPNAVQVAFASSADDLVVDDYNQASDLFLRDATNQTTTLLTEAQTALPQRTGAGFSSLGKNALSEDGRFVLFRSFSPFLALQHRGNLDYLTADVIVRDLLLGTNIAFRPGVPTFDAILSSDGQSVVFSSFAVSDNIYGMELFARAIEGGTNRSVSAQFQGGAPVSRTPQNPVISRDGNLTVFEGPDAFSLSPIGIYLYNLRSNRTEVVSARQFSASNGSRDSTAPNLSPDARWVTFQSLASDLTPDSVDGVTSHLFARDLIAAQTILLSKYQGAPLTGNSTGAVISADSRKVAFANGSDRIFIFDLQAGTNRLSCSACRGPALNSAGTFLAYEASEAGAPRQIYSKSLLANTTELISVNRLGTGGGNAPSRSPILSGNGRLVVFLSAASDLVPNDTNGETDLFLRDTLSQTTFLLSPGKEDYSAGTDLFKGLTGSLNGQRVVFQSFASRLSPQDYNDTSDIFALELGAGDTDGDGLDDQWEITYFNNLQRDGNGDFDHDGVNDREEYNRGTNPAGDSGALAITALVRNPDGSVVLYWPSIPGRAYRVEARTDLRTSDWSEIVRGVLSDSSASSYRDPNGQELQRFYRVVLLP